MGLPMDFACDSANGAVYMSEDTDSPHQVISIAAHDPDLNPMLVYEIGGVSPGHADSEYKLSINIHSVGAVYCWVQSPLDSSQGHTVRKFSFVCNCHDM